MQHIQWCRLLAVGAMLVPFVSHAQGPEPKIREIVTIPGVEIDAAVLLPNGRAVIYTVGDSIFARDLATGRSTFLTGAWSGHLRISAASDRLAFTGYTEAGDDIIMSMPIDPRTGLATGPAQRVSMSIGDEPSLSPDGKLVAFGIQRGKGIQDLAVVSVTGGPERVLARYGEARIGETYWSADGKWVIAQVSRDPARDKWTLERVPVGGGRSDPGFAFTGYQVGSFDGRISFHLPQPSNQSRRQGRVTYTSSVGAHGEFHIPRGSYLGNGLSSERVLAVVATRQDWAHIVNLADGKVRELRPGSLHSRGPVWSPDGRKIALHDSTGGVYGITVMNADGSGARNYPIAAFPSYTRWAPNGQSLAFSFEPRAAGPAEVGVLDLATGTTRVVSVAPKATLVDYRWRADGRSLLVMKWFPGQQNGPLVRQVFEAPLTGKERMLRDISVEFPKLTRGGPISGELLVLGENLNTDHYFLAPDGGSLVKMPRLELGGFSGEPGVSPDGKWVAFPARNRNGPGTNIHLVSVAGDSLRVLRMPFEIGPSTFRPPFTPDGRNLILFGKAPGESVSKIYSVPLDGSAPKALATLPTTSTVAGRLDLSPDGSAVVITSVGPWTSKIYEIDVTPILQSMRKQ